MVLTANMSNIKSVRGVYLLIAILLSQACAAGNFEIANMLTYAAEQVLGRKGVLEVMVESICNGLIIHFECSHLRISEDCSFIIFR